MLPTRPALLGAALALALAAALLLGRTGQMPTALEDLRAGTPTYLSDLPWDRASTEWLMVGNEGLPAVDAAFYTGEPLVLGHRAFSKGFGTHAPSEIVYRLKGDHAFFAATIGVQDDDLPGRAAARFLIFLDGTVAYESSVMDKDSGPVEVQVPIKTIQELRLVVARSEDSRRGARAAWADARLLPDPFWSRAAPDGFVQRIRALGQARAGAREEQALALAEGARGAVAALQAGLRGALPKAQDLPLVTHSTTAGTVTILNNHLAVVFGLGGRGHGTMTILDLGHQRFVGVDLSSALVLPDQAIISLPRDTRPRDPGGFTTDLVDYPVLGQGVQLRIPLATTYPNLDIIVGVTLFQDSPLLLYGLAVDPPPPGAGDFIVRYLDASSEGRLNLGDRVHYLADSVRLRHVVTSDDGLLRQDLLGWGKPVYLWNEGDPQGLLLALLEETAATPLFTYQQDPGQVAARAGLAAPLGPTPGAGAGPGTAALLYLEVTEGASPQEHFARYRKLMAHLYPPPPLPRWFKYQWLSWYVYAMDINEAELVRHIDLIAEHFGDLGPWHIIVDAGWYVAEGREGAEWRRQDRAKFPRGLRWLVDYAHSRGVYVVLYFNAPYLTSRQSAGDWMGLRGIVESHPEWLISLDEGPVRENYSYNFRHPGLRAYLEEVLRDYFLRYDVDGIKLDGLGTSDATVLYTAQGNEFGLSDRVLAQTLEIYRFVWEQANRYGKEVYVESGWVTPVLANPYSHTFRYGDEEPVYSRPYPLPGLVEHIDYAAYQQGLLGQRSNMGAIYGNPGESDVTRWWLGAALALGTQAALSFDLDLLTPALVSQYRALLAPYRPFEGTTTIDAALEQRTFFTRVEDTWYVGLLNRAPGPRRLVLQPTALGLPPGTPFAVYDVETGRFYREKGPLPILLEAESFRLLVVRTQPGLLWSNSRFEGAPEGGPLVFRVTAPPTVPGVASLYIPKPRAVYWDGLRLEPAERLFQGSLGYSYDEAASVLTLWYPVGGEHTLRVTT